MLGAFAARLPLSYIVINLDPIALQLGNLTVRWYGIGYVVAISVALWALLRYADAMGVAREHIWSIFIWAAIAGLVGARLYYVIQQPDLVEKYLKQPGNILAVWNGGMAFFGAIFLGAPTGAFMAWRRGISPWLGLDMGGFFAAIGQMFGRLGNLVNGDIVGYAAGHPTIPQAVCTQAPCIAFVPDPHVLPWATAYLNIGSFVTQRGVPYQPSAAYEIIINLIVLAILWPLRFMLPRRIGTGAFFSLYVAMYAIGQFVVFYARSNIFVSFLGIDTLKQAQWTAIFTFIGIALLYYFVIRRVNAIWTFDRANPLPVEAGPGNATPHPAVSSGDAPSSDPKSPTPVRPRGAAGG
jgi:phosphatidylglycerol---prolipoprotein diacylglyceryl transferase